MANGTYPVDIAVDYPAKSSRGWAICTMLLFIKPLTLITHLIILYALFYVSCIFFFLGQIVILFTGKYPESMARLIANTMAWHMRVSAFMYGLCDQYPPFSLDGDASYALRFSYDYPEKSSRGWAICTMFFIRFLVLTPHIIVIYALGLVVSIFFFISQIAVLFTGKYPRGMFDFVVGVMRWETRVFCFALGLTDKYPPFTLKSSNA
jgi:hypothetical protein